jgi:hypothetical protein
MQYAAVVAQFHAFPMDCLAVPCSPEHGPGRRCTCGTALYTIHPFQRIALQWAMCASACNALYVSGAHVQHVRMSQDVLGMARAAAEVLQHPWRAQLARRSRGPDSSMFGHGGGGPI